MGFGFNGSLERGNNNYQSRRGKSSVICEVQDQYSEFSLERREP